MVVSRRYAVILEEGENGYLVVSCPALPGCHTQGKTRPEALANIREAIELCLEVLLANGEPVPEEDTETVLVSISIGYRPF